MIQITPDEVCLHVEAGAERVGGVHFPNSDPPVSIGMCQPCLDWCKGNLERIAPLNTDATEMDRRWQDDDVINADLISGETS